MKIKYFLRGLGMGIVFSAVLILAVGGTKKVNLTDEEIIMRASLLGMVMPESVEDTKTPEASTEPEEDIEAEEDTESEDDTESEETEETPVSEDNDTSQTSGESVAEESAVEPEYATVQIRAGMWSKDVAKAMEDAGVVSSAENFDEYLCDNGYASLITVGTYRIPIGADFYEIANKITK
jgi:hypothetical protein